MPLALSEIAICMEGAGGETYYLDASKNRVFPKSEMYRHCKSICIRIPVCCEYLKMARLYVEQLPDEVLKKRLLDMVDHPDFGGIFHTETTDAGWWHSFLEFRSKNAKESAEKWCIKNNVPYQDTVQELWRPKSDEEIVQYMMRLLRKEKLKGKMGKTKFKITSKPQEK